MYAIKFDDTSFFINGNLKSVATPGRRIEMRSQAGDFYYSDVLTAEYLPSPDNRTKVFTIYTGGGDPEEGSAVPNDLIDIRFGLISAPNFGGAYPSGPDQVLREGSLPRDTRYYTRSEITALLTALFTHGDAVITIGNNTVTVPEALVAGDSIVVTPQQQVALYVYDMTSADFKVGIVGGGVATEDIHFMYVVRRA